MNIDRHSSRRGARGTCILLAAAWLLAAGPARSQAPPPGSAGSTPPTLDDTMEAGESEAVESPRRQMVKWNEYEGPYFTIRAGGGFLVEGAAFEQDEESKQQLDLESDWKVRDARLSLKGRFPKFKRAVTWTSGIMYDGPTDQYLVRETGVMIAVPELRGHIFVGRTKEGFSLNKVMVGYAGWTMERSTINDATIPILADGIKWLGYIPERHLLWNLGFYKDWFSEGQTFSTYDTQAVGRIAWLPVASEKTGTLVHIGLSGRYGEPDEGKLKLRSRPEAFPAPYFVDTGSFPCDKTEMLGLEAYYRPGPWLFGTEYFVQWADAKASGDPVFHGGEMVATWLITGETRSYNTRGGFFNSVSPARSVFEGGPGAWEAVARVSYIDLDGGTLHGGKFWRFTPMVNWHLSDHLRLEFAYGYGELDRFDLKGATHFFQTRLQMTL
jgi:phosphate-selective porin OprO/OprP